MQSLETLLKRAEIPISDTDPVGYDIRYDDEFEFIEDELAKQGSLIDRGPVDWEQVTQTAINLLINKSKDLKVSCYLIRALYELENFKGLASGLKINQLLIETFWDELFPSKERARSNAYEWLVSKFEALFYEVEPNPEQLDCIEQSFEIIQNIELFLNKKLLNNAPALGKFRRSIGQFLELLREQKNNEEQLIQIKPKLTAELKKASEKTLSPNNNKFDNNSSKNKQTSQTDTHHPANGSESFIADNIIVPINNIEDKDRNKILRQCHEAMRNLAKWSLIEKLDSPSAYSMNRFSTWMGINQLPIHTNNVTPLKPVPKDKLDAYTSLFLSEDYQVLIPQVELSFSKSPFWLDAHRLVAQGLEALNMHESARAVKDYTALFVKRFPSIVDLKFSDNSNFADSKTRQWISAEVLSKQINTCIQAGDATKDNEYEDVLAQANDLVQNKNITEAVQLFKNQIVQQGGLKQRIFWKYYLARFCYDQGYTKLSMSLLQEVDRFVQKNSLESWEPDLVKNVVYLSMMCLKQLQSNFTSLTDEVGLSESRHPGLEENVSGNNRRLFNSNNHEEINDFYMRLCQLDPVLALDIE